MDGSDLLAPIAAAPRQATLVLDVDGTLAPIVARPELARVPAETREELRRLAGLYLLVACVSGRPGPEAATLVGVPGIVTIGNHGLELIPDADAIKDKMAGFRRSVYGRWPVEDKGLSLSYHYRETGGDDAPAALREIAALAEAAGLESRWGRKVLEIRPRTGVDKGTAVERLVRDAGARTGLYAGDDVTDLDAFRGLDDAGLEHAVRIAVASPEVNPRLLAAADLVVDGPAGLLAVLRAL